jgi:hypothetical protein
MEPIYLQRDYTAKVHRYDAGALLRYLNMRRDLYTARTADDVIHGYLLETIMKQITDKLYKGAFSEAKQIRLKFNIAQIQLLSYFFKYYPVIPSLMPLEYELINQLNK